VQGEWAAGIAQDIRAPLQSNSGENREWRVADEVLVAEAKPITARILPGAFRAGLILQGGHSISRAPGRGWRVAGDHVAAGASTSGGFESGGGAHAALDLCHGVGDGHRRR